MDEEGDVKSEVRVHVSYEMYPHWLLIAIGNVSACKMAAREVDRCWDQGRTLEESRAIENELRLSMQIVVAVAAAIDGFYGTITTFGMAAYEESSERERKTARFARVLEIFKTEFDIDAGQFRRIRDFLKILYKFRDEAVHPTGRLREPLQHPRLNIMTEQRLCMYSRDNAINALTLALELINLLIKKAKVSRPDIVSYCVTASELMPPVNEEWERVQL